MFASRRGKVLRCGARNDVLQLSLVSFGSRVPRELRTSGGWRRPRRRCYWHWPWRAIDVLAHEWPSERGKAALRFAWNITSTPKPRGIVLLNDEAGAALARPSAFGLPYFRHAACKEALREIDTWLRRKLRCVRLKQCKRAKAIADFLVKCGVPARRAWPLAVSGKGWWRRSGSPPANEAMTLQWFAKLRLVSLQAHHAALQSAGNRRVR